jgi:hypothetical protein
VNGERSGWISHVRFNEYFTHDAARGELALVTQQVAFASHPKHDQRFVANCPLADLRVFAVFQHELGQRVGGLDDRLRWSEVFAREDVHAIG